MKGSALKCFLASAHVAAKGFAYLMHVGDMGMGLREIGPEPSHNSISSPDFFDKAEASHFLWK